AGPWEGRLAVEHEYEQDREQNAPANARSVVGGDLGSTTLATRCAGGPRMPTPRPVKRRLRTRTRVQRAVTPKQHGSKDCKQAVRRLGRLSRTVAHQRQHTVQQHTVQQLTTRLANTTSVVVIEELERGGPAQAPPPGPGDRGCGLLRVQAATSLQS